jgi:hypothetical protein
MHPSARASDASCRSRSPSDSRNRRNCPVSPWTRVVTQDAHLRRAPFDPAAGSTPRIEPAENGPLRAVQKGVTGSVDTGRTRALHASEAMGRRYLFSAITISTVVIAAVGPTSALAGGGNSANAKLCQKNGWQTAQSDEGGSFSSNDDCTAYAAGGGTLFTPALVHTQDGCLTVNDNGPFALVHFDVTGFHPTSSISFFLPGETFPLPVAVTTDATGSASLPGFVLYDPGPAAITAIDAEGVHATVNFTASC